MVEARKIAGNTIALMTGKLIRLVIAMVLGVVLVRYLGPFHLGNWKVALSAAELLTILSAMGIGKIAIRECASRRDEIGRYLGTIWSLKLIFGLISFLAALIIVRGLGYHAEIAHLLFVALGIYILTSLGETFIIRFRTREKMGYEALANISKDLFLMFAIFLAIYLGWGILRIAYLYLAGAVFYLIVSWVIADRKLPPLQLSLDLKLSRHLLMAGLPLGLAVFFNAYHDASRLIIQQTIGSAGAGYYSAAVLLYLALESTVVLSLMGSLFPILSRYHASNNRGLIELYRRMSRYLYIISLLSAVFCLFLGDEIILLLFNPAYGDSIPVLKLLGPVMILMFQNYLLYNAMVASHREKLFALVMGGSALINAGGIFLLSGLIGGGGSVSVVVPLTGISLFTIRLIRLTAAPAALAAAQIFSFIIFSRILRREYGEGILHNRWVRPAAAAVISGLLIWFESRLDFPLGVIAASSVIVYVAALVIFRGIDAGDLQLLKNLFSGWISFLSPDKKGQ